MCGLSLVGGELGLPFIAVRGLLIAVAPLVAEHGLQARRLQQLWRTGLVAPWHVGSSWTRARTHVPLIGKQILNHCTTREAPSLIFFIEVQLIYNVVLISAVQQSDSVIHIYTFFSMFFFHYGLSQDIEYSSLYIYHIFFIHSSVDGTQVASIPWQL